MSDSDSGDEPIKKKIEIGPGESQKRQARIIHEKALKEDPTIFQYDELYDDMTASREEAKKSKSTEVKESKYIERLLITADKRKKEYERRIERQVQKEREAEGEKYKDKEVFVTASYRAKLEEIKIAEEQERRDEYLEAIGDVTKQKDLDGFYRHLYEQKVGEDEKKIKSKLNIESNETESLNITKPTKQRSYRKHQSNENDDETDEKEPSILIANRKKGDEDGASKKVHLQSNIDADSDFEIDSESDSEEQKTEKIKDEELLKENVKVVEGPKVNDNAKTTTKSKGNAIEEEKISLPENEKVEIIEKQQPEKPKIDVWKKRTIGEAFDGALQRYYERKQLRCS